MMERRILIISYYFSPYDGMAAQRANRVFKYLKRFGWEPFVLTVRPRYYSSNNGSPCSSNVFRTPAIQIQKTYLSVKDFLKASKSSYISDHGESHAAGGTALKKLRSLAGNLLSLPDHQIGWYFIAFPSGIFLVLRNKIQYIFSTGPPWTNHLVALFLKLILKKKWVADFRDPWATNPWKRSLPPILQRYERLMESLVLRNADYVVCNTEELKGDIITRYPGTRNKIGVVSNGYDPDDFQGLKPTERTENGKLRIMHSGTIYGMRDLTYFFRAVGEMVAGNQINAEDIRVTLVGDIDEEFRRKIRSTVKELNLGTVIEIKGWVPRKEALRLASEADVLLVIQPETGLQVPGKIYEYLALKRPILALGQDRGPTENLVRATGSGIVVPWQDVAEIRGAIGHLWDSYSKGELAGAFPFTSYHNYAEPHLASEIDGILKSL